MTDQSKPYRRNAEVFPDTEWPEGMERVALAVEYLGTHYHGFQTQASGVTTVQQTLERALSAVAAEPITLVCAGRTDAGVHATTQIVHFDTLAKRPEKAWVRGTRAQLPLDISIRWARPVVPSFHARFSATARTYRYLISDRSTYSGLVHQQVTWSRKRLDEEAMRAAAESLVGEHDFTSFRASQCQARSPVRRIEHLHIVRRGDLLVIEVKANAFLHHMVRNIVGVLMAIGSGEAQPGWMAEILAARDRSAGGVTARPFGLYLVAVDYPVEFGLPVSPPGPLFVPEPVGGLA
ncbi:tRNA pseudouridine(38-40) synthase TruA [Marinimicrobium sp. ABcell2]|uniref:tRNA pseudouridine(38-40) synthase TruA n=1 Tax=Marinimicrobium sp. ABcell2 TaxID=3069751 RepID=UPI0027B1B10A|nr:tRNA pseudouridine(38-40) synthase TruA [Marinimicrobium sp. ABcell2]MDQ2075532.1 tRNA pseudouridine(38-40) synthase TruA [Marinimicrobium sp. ABcell2]